MGKPYNFRYTSLSNPAYTPPKKRHVSLRWFLRLGLVVSILLIGYHFIGTSGLAIFQKHFDSRVKAAQAEPPLTVLTPNQESQMGAKINSVIQAHPDMDIGVAVEDLNNGKFYHYGISNPFIAASVSKVLTASLFMHGVEQGQYSLSQNLSYGTASYELQQMIEQSDNTAWEDFNGLLGHAALQAYGTQIGLSNYDPDQNTLTVDDIAVLLGKLFDGKLLNKSDTQLILSYMKDANFDDYIPASVPTGVKVFHKAGWLDDRVHDSAIIDNGKHPYVLVIFSKMDDGSQYNEDEGHQVFAGITGATTAVFL